MKKTAMIVGGIALLAALLAAGAYTAVQLLSAAEPQATSAGPGRVMESVMVENDGSPVSVRTTILPSPDLPAEESAAFGVFISRQDDNIIIGTGNIDLDVDIEVDPQSGQEQTTVIPRTDGPELEVVISNDTQIYRDVTDLSGPGPSKSGEREIQQQVKRVDSAEDIGQNTEIEVWGDRRGDRLFATTVVFGPIAGGAFE